MAPPGWDDPAMADTTALPPPGLPAASHEPQPSASSVPVHRVRLQAPDGVAPTLAGVASVTWRVLVILAGIWVLGQIVGYVGAVVLALFFAMLMTALAGPISRALQRFLPKVLSVVISLLLIATLFRLGLNVSTSRLVLAEGDAGPEHIVRMTWYVTDKREYLAAGPAVGAAFRDLIGSYGMAMTAVQVSALMEDRAKVEIEVTAVIPG